jgi:amino acid adenylation domain-containing protein
MQRLETWVGDAARRHPHAIALEMPGRSITYAELWSRAGMWQRAIGRHRRVGVFAVDSLDCFAGYLGILRAGATAVPLGPAEPADRIRRICAAAGLEAVIDDGSLPSTAGSLTRIGRRPQVEGEHDPEDDAYIMFTSGSTGTPKGVPIGHRNVDSFLAHVADRYELRPGCRVSHTCDMTFDLSVLAVFATLSSGATLVLPSHSDRLRPVAYVNGRRITHWISVPSAVAMAARSGALRPGSMPALRWSLFCGDQLTLAHAEAWQSAAPHGTIENMYGPTELTVSCAQFRLPHDRALWPETANGTVPIGFVYPHLDWKVDEAGELWVRGPQRFAGYLDPADNEGRFAPEDSRPRRDHWYRTGDLVRQDEVHGLLHLGRVDHQLQVRGYRIEAGEVEMAVRSHDEVDEAVALVGQDDDAATLTVCYSGKELSPRILRAHVARRLPAYMVPHRFRHLDVMPLNRNGKIDRIALHSLLLAS